MAVTTLGRQLVKQALPAKYKSFVDQPLTAKRQKELTTALAKEDPDAYIDTLQKLNDIGQRVVSVYGKDTTITLDDVDAGAKLKNTSAKLKELIRATINRKDLTPQEKQQKVIQLGYKYSAKMKQLGVEDANARKTGLANQIASGSRGNPVQLMQLIVGDMMMKDAMNRDIPYLAMMPYVEGDSPLAYWASAMSGRKSTYDVQAATGRVGYLSKQATNTTHSTPISTQDCGTTDTGVPVKAADTENIASVLLYPWKQYKAGTPITQDMIAQADDDQEIIIRSPITCKAHGGVCAKCAGIQQNGKFPAIGTYVALNSVKSFVEPLTQAGISSKHGSGMGGVKNQDPEGEDQPTGFDSVQRMLLAPKVFPGGAVLSSVDGRVTQIRKAPQGGHFITVGSTTIYSPVARTVTAKVGDVVEAGDMLTNGVPNPMQIVKYKGIGQGRHYFTKKLAQILPKAGAGTLRRNLEQFSRAMINKVRITDQDGYGGYYPGDLVDYDDIQDKWVPRDDSKQLPVKDAKGQYLQKPALYYSIGTRITPSVMKKLQQYGVKSIVTNQAPPPFEPQFVPSKQFVLQDKNWLPRLSGQRLRDSIFDAARKGITDRYDSHSFVDKIIVEPYNPAK